MTPAPFLVGRGGGGSQNACELPFVVEQQRKARTSQVSGGGVKCRVRHSGFPYPMTKMGQNKPNPVSRKVNQTEVV